MIVYIIISIFILKLWACQPWILWDSKQWREINLRWFNLRLEGLWALLLIVRLLRLFYLVWLEYFFFFIQFKHACHLDKAWILSIVLHSYTHSIAILSAWLLIKQISSNLGPRLASILMPNGYSRVSILINLFRFLFYNNSFF